MTGGDAEDAYLAKRYKAARDRDDTEIPSESAKRIQFIQFWGRYTQLLRSWRRTDR